MVTSTLSILYLYVRSDKCCFLPSIFLFCPCVNIVYTRPSYFLFKKIPTIDQQCLSIFLSRFTFFILYFRHFSSVIFVSLSFQITFDKLSWKLRSIPSIKYLMYFLIIIKCSSKRNLFSLSDPSAIPFLVAAKWFDIPWMARNETSGTREEESGLNKRRKGKLIENDVRGWRGWFDAWLFLAPR